MAAKKVHLLLLQTLVFCVLIGWVYAFFAYARRAHLNERWLLIAWPATVSYYMGAVGLAVTGVQWLAFLWKWSRGEVRRPVGVACHTCGHLLYGLSSPHCPECGAPVEHPIRSAPDPTTFGRWPPLLKENRQSNGELPGAGGDGEGSQEV